MQRLQTLDPISTSERSNTEQYPQNSSFRDCRNRIKHLTLLISSSFLLGGSDAKPEILICFFFIHHKIDRKIPKPGKNWEDDRKPLPFPNLGFKNKQGTKSNAQTTLSSYSRSKPEFIPPPQDFSKKKQLRYPGVWLKLDIPDEIRPPLHRLCYGFLRKTSQKCLLITGVKITETLYHSYTLTGTK